MTDAASAHPRAAGEGTWVMPLLVLAPVAVVRLFIAELSAAWLVISVAFCVLSAGLLVAGWVTVSRHGMRGAAGWVTCLLAHLSFTALSIMLFRD
ncbi:hypothetical protein [Streptomyces sp. S1]|uniref:hypothetical protein n=1 Tax=Streptomyces sp. S1 TaxID=718288 RepID=UPI003D765786